MAPRGSRHRGARAIADPRGAAGAPPRTPCRSRWSAPATAAPACSRAPSASPGWSRPSARRPGRARRCATCSSRRASGPTRSRSCSPAPITACRARSSTTTSGACRSPWRLRPEVLLAYEMNGRPLEPQHGAPLRLLVPGWYGMTSVKWLTRITAVTEPFAGYQQAVAYRYQHDEDDPGEGVSRMRVRALMIPPGHPDFLTRRRMRRAGRRHGARARLERQRRGRAGAVRRRRAWRDADLKPRSGPSPGGAGPPPGTPRRASTSSRAARPTRPATAAARAVLELPGHGQHLVQTVPVTVGRA